MASRRVCIIGDSHTAALKRGWETLRMEWADIELEIFSASRTLLEYIAVEGNTLVATDRRLRNYFAHSSGGKTEIAPDYDVYVLCGLGLSPHNVTYVYNRCRAFHHALEPKLPLVSGAMLRAAIASQLDVSDAFRMLRTLRQITGAPALLIASPLPARARTKEFWPEVEKNGDVSDLLSVFRSVCASVLREMNAEFIRQPEETLADECATRDEFGRNAERLFPGHPDDYSHMNGAYGAIILRAVLERIAAL